jgi:hypothetical protein
MKFESRYEQDILRYMVQPVMYQVGVYNPLNKDVYI